MKRLVSILIALNIILSTHAAWATPTDFSGGVNDDTSYDNYEEIVFISGEPVKFKGKVTITESTSNETKKSFSYKFELKPEDKDISGSLKRSTAYDVEYVKRTDIGQTTAKATLRSNQTEEIKLGSDTYKLQDMKFSKSDIIDNRPAADFSSGNIMVKKVYSINSTLGKVVLEGSGTSVGYQNFWGNTETQLIDYVVTYERQVPNTADGNDPNAPQYKDISWQGNYKVQVSDSTTKELSYSDNSANMSSFNGGYTRVTNREMVSKYEYDLPRMKESKYGYALSKITLAAPDSVRRNSGAAKLSKSMFPKSEALIVPKFKDTGGHWAQGYIEKLYSLDVFDDNSSFFLPEISMTRKEFIRGIIKACNIRTNTDTKRKTTVTRSKIKEESIFSDLDLKDPDYEYVKDAVQKGVIKGSASNIFSPDAALTRAQAITIMIRALGFDNKAPTPGYNTVFADDKKIPDWAKDSIYVAAEFGIIQGDEYNQVNPDKEMTRAEASAMMVRFLEFLQKDLQQDYRENLIYFN